MNFNKLSDILAFGRFAGMQISWFDLLNMIATVAALANLFVDYLATFFPSNLTSWNPLTTRIAITGGRHDCSALDW